MSVTTALKDLKVIVADDSELIRDLLTQALSNVEGLRLVGMAENGAEAIELTTNLKPDLLILDMAMPNKNGIDVLKHIRKKDSALMIVMFTADQSAVLREACLQAGADYYLDKCQVSALIDICQQQLLGG